jgi:hypothetical protein
MRKIIQLLYNLSFRQHFSAAKFRSDLFWILMVIFIDYQNTLKSMSLKISLKLNLSELINLSNKYSSIKKQSNN